MGPTAALAAVVAVVTALLAATATAQGAAGPQVVALSAEGQTPEPPGPARLEASGESDLSTAAHLGKAVTSVAFPGSPPAPEPRDPRDPRDPRPGGAESSSESDPERGDPDPRSGDPDPRSGARTGPLSDVPSQSSESEEGGRREPESEEALETQGL